MGDKKKYDFEYVKKDLKRYRMVDTKTGLMNLKQWVRIKYLNKTKDAYYRGGWLFMNDSKNGKYILEGLVRPKGRPIRWTVYLKDIIVFTRDKRKK